MNIEAGIIKKRRTTKYKSVTFWGETLWAVIRFIILMGLCFMILYPLIIKIATCFMSYEDLTNPTVKLFAREGSFVIVKQAASGMDYWSTMKNTMILSLAVSVVQMMISSIAGYGLARFKFKGRKVMFAAIVVTLLIPPQTLTVPLFVQFSRFNIINTYWPFVLLSFTGMGLKNGLYIYMMRQFFLGMPHELEQSAYIDGAGPIRTFFSVMLPNARNMMLTIFIFSFTWQWTDNTITPMYLPNTKVFVNSVSQLTALYVTDPIVSSSVNQVAALIIALPILIIYFFTQRYIVQGVERSGIVG